MGTVSRGATRLFLAVAILATALVGLNTARDVEPAAASHITGSVGSAEFHRHNDGTSEVHIIAIETARWDRTAYFSGYNAYEWNGSGWAAFAAPASCGTHTAASDVIENQNTDPSLRTVVTGQYSSSITKVTIDTTCWPDNKYLFMFGDCCRVGGILNNGSENTSLEYVLRVGGPNDEMSPSFNASLLNNIAYGLQSSFSQYLNALGQNNSAVTYEVITNIDSGPLENGSDPLPCSTLNGSTGLLTIKWQNCPGANDAAKQAAFGVAYGGGTPDDPSYYSFKVKVTDANGNIATRDVLFKFAVTTNQPPVITPSASCEALALQGGQTTTITFSATDPDTGELVNFVTNQLPSWATFTISGQGTANPVGTLTLSPPAGLDDVAQIVISAFDDNTFSLASSTQCNMVVGNAVLPGFEITPIAEPVVEQQVALPTFTG